MKVRDVRCYLVEVASARAGIAAMEMLFDLLKDAAFDFSVGIDDNIGSENGWAIEKVGKTFMFQFICIVPTHGFQHGHGSVYMYASGTDGTRTDWPAVEGASIPKRCLLSKDKMEQLLSRLCKSDCPSESAGFEFDPECWEHVC
ncbi:MAG: hypothetical protein H6823_10970 [Planctomycetaceae bacterium]|nr:hypothetical protein [Planctomycetales bacterium]MCB9938755.1 hypothetical protein [Planctomycetaceae bacterium]